MQMLDFDQPEHLSLFNNFRNFSEKFLNENVSQRDKIFEFSQPILNEFYKSGLCNLLIPEDKSEPISLLESAIIFEALGSAAEDGGMLFSLGAHLFSGQAPFLKYASQEQLEKYLPMMKKEPFIISNALTESDGGSDAFSMSSSAIKQNNVYTINANKAFISNASIANLLLCFVATDKSKGSLGGITCFLIEKKEFKYSNQIETIGLRACPLNELFIDNLELGPERILGVEGGGNAIFQYAMQWERVGLAAMQIGILFALLNKSTEYAKSRIKNGKPLFSHQAVSHTLAEMKVRHASSRALLYQTIKHLDLSSKKMDDSAILKLMVSENLVQQAQAALHIFGAAGLTEPYIERTLRDSQAALFYSGTSNIQKNIIASFL